MSDFDKKLRRNINDVKRGIRNLRKLGLRIEAQEVESMMGEDVANVYVVDRISGHTILQKHLFSIGPNK